MRAFLGGLSFLTVGKKSWKTALKSFPCREKVNYRLGVCGARKNLYAQTWFGGFAKPGKMRQSRFVVHGPKKPRSPAVFFLFWQGAGWIPFLGVCGARNNLIWGNCKTGTNAGIPFCCPWAKKPQSPDFFCFGKVPAGSHLWEFVVLEKKPLCQNKFIANAVGFFVIFCPPVVGGPLSHSLPFVPRPRFRSPQNGLTPWSTRSLRTKLKDDAQM